MMNLCVPSVGEEYREVRNGVSLAWVVVGVDERQPFPGFDVPGVVRICVAEDGPEHSIALLYFCGLVHSGRLVRVANASGDTVVLGCLNGK